MCVIDEVKGDLFTAPEDASLAHCVSADLNMGKGIAVLFKDKYGNVNTLRRQPHAIGNVVGLTIGQRVVFYMITKEKYYHKPTYGSIRTCLDYIAAYCATYHITHLCMPRIGCGLDRKVWSVVLDHIKEAFSGVDMRITIYTL